MGKPRCQRRAGLSLHFGESVENYSSSPELHQMLTRQGAACMAQQCSHEQPEETMQKPIRYSSLFGPDDYSCEPHILKLARKNACLHMMAMIRTALTHLIIICGLDLHRVLRKALLGHKCCTELSHDRWCAHGHVYMPVFIFTVLHHCIVDIPCIYYCSIIVCNGHELTHHR